MNPSDQVRWNQGLAKLEAGQVDALTDAEREVLCYFGGDAMAARLVRKPREVSRRTTRGQSVAASAAVMMTTEIKTWRHW
jgi:hypothetical protein